MLVLTDVVLLALLGTAPGKLLRVGPEHILAKPSVGTGLHGGMTGGDTLLVWDRLAWLALHGIGVSKLRLNRQTGCAVRAFSPSTLRRTPEG